MRLTEEESKKLMEDILNDLPEGFALFPPWMSLFFVQLFGLIISGAISIVTLEIGLGVPPPYLVAIYFCIFFPAILVPNIILSLGRKDLSLKLIRLAAKFFIIVALLGFLMIDRQLVEVVLQLLAVSLACLTLFITHTVRFQAFALHRSRMAAWSKERMRKNKAFKEAIKQKRRGK